VRINEQAQQILAAQKAKKVQGMKGTSELGSVKGAAEVSMSTAGQEIGKALQVLAGLPDVRTERVAELKARIESGNYNVTGQDVARSILGGDQG
jgi:negative regulator of flagellin synthesis FlgM